MNKKTIIVLLTVILMATNISHADEDFEAREVSDVPVHNYEVPQNPGDTNTVDYGNGKTAEVTQ